MIRLRTDKFVSDKFVGQSMVSLPIAGRAYCCESIGQLTTSSVLTGCATGNANFAVTQSDRVAP